MTDGDHISPGGPAPSSSTPSPDSDKHQKEPLVTTFSDENVRPEPVSSTKWKWDFWSTVRVWWALIAHFIVCVGMAMTIIFALDDYMALDASTPRPPRSEFRFRASDITTLVSAGLVLVRIAVESWAAVTVWRCAFVLLEKTGLNLPELNDLMSWPRLPRRKPKKIVGWAVGLTLLLIFPQSYLSPLLAGSIDWLATLQISGSATVLYEGRPPNSQYTFLDPLYRLYGDKYSPPGYPEGTLRTHLDWLSYTNNTDPRYSQATRSMLLTEAIAHSGIMWRSGDHDPLRQQRTCRRIMRTQGEGKFLPTGSILYNASIPCIEIQSITWGNNRLETEFGSPNFYDLTLKVQNISASGQRLLDSIPGSAILFDKNQIWTNRSPGELLPYPNPKVIRDHTRSFIIGLSGIIPIVNNGTPSFTCPKANRDIFPIFGNLTIGRAGDALVGYPTDAARPYCMTHAKVTLTAGLLMFPESTFLWDNVVEGNFTSKKGGVKDWMEDRWAEEALKLLPSVMVSVAAMNQSSIPAWNDLDGYVEKLIRISYLASWSAIRQTMEDPPEPAYAKLAHKRLQAKVDKIRVIIWLIVSLLLQISGLVWYYGAQRWCRRGVVVDAQVAALLTDAAELLSDLSPDQKAQLTNISIMPKEEDRVGTVKLMFMDGKYGLRPPENPYNGHK